jgi:hypothetical protein
MKQIIINYVQSLTEYPLNERSRYHHVTDYRHLLIYLLKKYHPHWGYRKVVWSFDFNDFGLVPYVIEKYEGRLQVDNKFKRWLDGHIEKVEKLMTTALTPTLMYCNP